MRGYKFIEWEHPLYSSNGASGKSMLVKAVDPGVPGLLIVPRITWTMADDIRKHSMVCHVASGYIFSGPHKSIAAAIKNAKESGKLFDWKRFKTPNGFQQIMRKERELCKQLKVLAGRKV